MLMAKTTTVVNLNGSIEIYDFEKAHWKALEHTGECIERLAHTHRFGNIFNCDRFFRFFSSYFEKKTQS